MPALSTSEAAERLAIGVEEAKPTTLMDIYTELFPEKPEAAVPSATDLARHVRNGLEAEELVDLWNVVFPADRNVWYDEQDEKIHYNAEALGYAEAD
jgi:hypothetical protein